MVSPSLYSCLFEELIDQSRPKVFLGMRDADMTRAQRMGENVVRTFHPTKYPTLSLKLFYNFLAVHVVYYTQHELNGQAFIAMNNF
jgi:hypothetical protein